MNDTPKLIVMLTHHDKTVENAFEVFDRAKDARAEYWGMKEKPLPLADMKRLYAYMRDCGKKTVLEVVAYTEEACLAGAQMSLDCGCDILMGTVFYDSVNEFCKAHAMKYMPFVGTITGRPSVLEGTLDDILEEAVRCIEKGAYGIDLLGYRYTGDAATLNQAVVSRTPGPVCIAGSVDSYRRLDELKQAAPWAFTIGGAFFEHQFGNGFREQIDRVCDYIQAPPHSAV